AGMAVDDVDKGIGVKLPMGENVGPGKGYFWRLSVHAGYLAYFFPCTFYFHTFFVCGGYFPWGVLSQRMGIKFVEEYSRTDCSCSICDIWVLGPSCSCSDSEEF